MALDLRQIEAPPDIGIKWRSDYISGVGRRGGGFVIIFDLPRLFSSTDTMLIASTNALEPATASSPAAPLKISA